MWMFQIEQRMHGGETGLTTYLSSTEYRVLEIDDSENPGNGPIQAMTNNL